MHAQSMASAQEGLWEEKEGLSCVAPSSAASSGMGCRGAGGAWRGPVLMWGWSSCGRGSRRGSHGAEGVFADSGPQPLGTQPSPKKYKPKKHKQMIT